MPDQRLQQRRGDLEHQRDDPGLEEGERKLVAKHRVERRRQRLHHVVEHVRGADGEQDAERRGCALRRERRSAQRGGASSRICPRAARLDSARGPKSQAAERPYEV